MNYAQNLWFFFMSLVIGISLPYSFRVFNQWNGYPCANEATLKTKVNTSHKSTRTDSITTTKQTETKRCGYFIGYTIYKTLSIYIYIYMGAWVVACIWESVCFLMGILSHIPHIDCVRCQLFFYLVWCDWLDHTSVVEAPRQVLLI